MFATTKRVAIMICIDTFRFLFSHSEPGHVQKSLDLDLVIILLVLHCSYCSLLGRSFYMYNVHFDVRVCDLIRFVRVLCITAALIKMLASILQQELIILLLLLAYVCSLRIFSAITTIRHLSLISINFYESSSLQSSTSTVFRFESSENVNKTRSTRWRTPLSVFKL